MVSNIIRRVWTGFGAAAVLSLIAIGILVITDTEATVTSIWLNLMGSMVMGGYFGAASFIFDKESWSPLKQVVIHFLLSLVVFFPLAVSVGWFPVRLTPLLMGAGIFLVTYILFWFVIRAILMRQAAGLNSTVKRK
ncbi:DUF3021 domain-containing protein [Paenibacillus sp. YPG26]|uniref:DUF3021 domain-containing protein n=1 Tax=Paenibacillus sp. YPG26 TaxID=2878915 RepID=UPI00203AFBE6|nr:DUF3021 domain-containing protein [Paenibacillus sp. YPG26]USB33172.1 DUF3021 domain-containing protein [Paenibacillus sp. YPG26]